MVIRAYGSIWAPVMIMFLSARERAVGLRRLEAQLFSFLKCGHKETNICARIVCPRERARRKNNFM
jgi:hypothetical protein